MLNTAVIMTVVYPELAKSYIAHAHTSRRATPVFRAPESCALCALFIGYVLIAVGLAIVLTIELTIELTIAAPLESSALRQNTVPNKQHDGTIAPLHAADQSLARQKAIQHRLLHQV